MNTTPETERMTKKLRWQLEGMWWLFTLVLVVGMLYPVWRHGRDFPFLWQNALFIVLFVTTVRYMFLLKYTFLAKAEKWKIGLIFASMLLLAFTYREWADFRAYLRADGFAPHFEHLGMDRMFAMARYARNELLFFTTGSMIALLLFPFRMIVSIWRVRNRGTV